MDSLRDIWKVKSRHQRLLRRFPESEQVAVEIMCLALASFQQVNARGETGAVAKEWQWLGWLFKWALLGKYVKYCVDWRAGPVPDTADPWRNLRDDPLPPEEWVKPHPGLQFKKFIFPIIRRVYPTLLANELVSVQPMTASAGEIFYMDYKYESTIEGPPEPVQYGPEEYRPQYRPNRLDFKQITGQPGWVCRR